MRTPRRVAGLLATAPLAALLTVAVPSQAAAAPDHETLCPGPVAELKAVQQRIRAHNARPNRSTSASYVAAYNAEAATLRADQNRAISRLMACERALDRAQAKHPRSEFMTPTAETLTKIDRVLKNITTEEKNAVQRWNAKTYEFPRYGKDGHGKNKKGMTKRVDMRPPKLPPSVQNLYSVIDDNRPKFPPTTYLQGVRAPSIGSPDNAYPASRNVRIQGVAMDHIVPLRRLVALPGFLRLTPHNMYVVAHSPVNAQWLSKKSNGSKGSGSAALTGGTTAAWRQQQARIRQEAEEDLKELIKDLLKSQGS
ncbi:hypothetical protein [Actinomadura sediminis]|uniref:HNH endonuclease n=1 Tax=Actinomadura sediminis TaxID=1038904 RepID=A0ABW3EPW1_9ACTN